MPHPKGKEIRPNFDKFFDNCDFDKKELDGV
jgi:hypothetical protein